MVIDLIIPKLFGHRSSLVDQRLEVVGPYGVLENSEKVNLGYHPMRRSTRAIHV